MATFDGGLCWYDRENDRFIRFQHDPKDEHSIIGNFIQMMFETSDSMIYVGAVGHGLSGFKIPKKVTGELRFINYKFPDEQFTANRWAGAMIEAGELGLLVAINGGGVNRFDSKHGNFIPILQDTVGTRAQCLLYDSKKRLWVGTWDDGLYVIDKRAGKIVHHEARGTLGYLNHHQFHSITEDEDGNIWLGTDNGLSLMKADVDPFTPAPFITFTHDPLDANSLLSNSIKGLFIDNRQRLWIATYFGGINMYDKSLLQFRTYKSNGQGTSGLSHSNVFCLDVDTEDNLWIGTDGGGLNIAKGPIDKIKSKDFVKVNLTHNGQSAEKIKCLEIGHYRKFMGWHLGRWSI